MCNAFIDGRKCSTLASSRALGPRRRIALFSNLSKCTDHRNGHRLQNTYPEGLESSAERDGTIISTPRSKRLHGVKRRSGFYIYTIEELETSGRILLRSWMVELTTQ